MSRDNINEKIERDIRMIKHSLGYDRRMSECSSFKEKLKVSLQALYGPDKPIPNKVLGLVDILNTREKN